MRRSGRPATRAPTSALNWPGGTAAVAAMTVQSVGPTQQVAVASSSPVSMILDVTGYLLAADAANGPEVQPLGATALANGVISDATGTGRANGDPLALLSQVYSTDVLAAGGAVSIVSSEIPGGGAALVPYDPTNVCGVRTTAALHRRVRRLLGQCPARRHRRQPGDDLARVGACAVHAISGMVRRRGIGGMASAPRRGQRGVPRRRRRRTRVADAPASPATRRRPMSCTTCATTTGRSNVRPRSGRRDACRSVVACQLICSIGRRVGAPHIAAETRQAEGPTDG